ncbi:hypothetical protein GCM10010528_12210 [Gordonia defluvii]|uniref:DUF6542 domain-containing protein n=1 Tax=Gordonia defluvii TaxID=283718 RepID=A0ABP6L7S6_9ACTN
MRFLQSEPDVPLAEQSAAATRRGVPWWGAVAIAFGFALLGIALDSAAARMFSLPDGVYARQICFALGCLLAALAVRNRALFTAAVQPPLIAVGLVIARVIGVKLKGLVTSANVPDLNSLLIKQVFAFSNDFPVILFTFLAVLTVVVARWWRYRTARQTQQPRPVTNKVRPPESATADAATRRVPTHRPPVARPESAAVRASRAAAAAQAGPPPRPSRPAAPGFRASPAVVPSSRPGGPAVRPRPDRMTAGAAAHGVRLDRANPSAPPRQPAVRPSAAVPPPVAPPQPGRRRAAPPPLDDEGF